MRVVLLSLVWAKMLQGSLVWGRNKEDAQELFGRNASLAQSKDNESIRGIHHLCTEPEDVEVPAGEQGEERRQ